MKKRSVVLSLFTMAFMAAGLLSCGGGGGGGGTPNTGTRQWTYMVYMGADNNLSEAGLGDINEMEMVGSSAGVAVVVQAEFSSQYTPGVPTDTRRIYVQNDGDTNSVNLNGTSIGNVNMADPAQLTAFINWAKTTYPADHYALVIWDHGGGWKAGKLASPLRGAVQDETSGTFMSLPDLAKGVADSGLHFDVINFDACLMAMYEVAYEFRGTADYMTFSEETEPGNGDPYDTILGALAANPAMTGRTLATTIVDRYQASYVADTRESTTKSAVDMAQIDALDTKILALAAALATDSTANTVVQNARTTTQEYAYPANHDIYDVCQYVATNAPAGAGATACSDLMTQIGSLVIDSKTTGSTTAKSHGLAIYLPLANETNSTDLADYGQLKCNLTSRAAASGTWGSYIESLTGGGTLQTGTGDYALYLYWTKTDGSPCDADLDLYVSEADGSWYSPWMGQTTPNGFFSPESSQAGTSEEYYLANPQVMQGYYDFLVNYYANGSTCTQALAHVLILDYTSFGDTAWHEPFQPVTMDLSNSYSTGCTTFSCIDSYSDWWYVGFTQRMIGSGVYTATGHDLPINSRNGKLVTRQRGSLLQGLTR